VMSTDEPRMWHITVTVGGAAHDLEEVRAGLERLVEERPFLLTVRYQSDRVELRYWEQADDLLDAASLALRLWNEHRDSARLPWWDVVGLEVLDRETFAMRVDEGTAPPPVAGAADVRPY
jgi:hypothetical protein